MTSRDLLVIINYKFWKGDFMAIFYKHIKGCGSNTTSNSSGCWSWIEWSNSTSSTPIIYTKSSNSTTSRFNLGSIITSNAENQSINKDFHIAQKLYFYKDQNDDDNSSYIEDNGTQFIWRFSKTAQIKAANGTITFNSLGGVEFSNTTSVCTKSNLYAESNLYGRVGLYVGTDTSYTPEKGTIKADSKCEALYFNAISDRRAKTNITPLSASALSIVKSLPVYTFNYNTKPEELTIGLIAQEAAEHNLDNFNMVDNLDASGENNDFMQMKESKLVYVLWKAVQELSAEVESLKAQLNNK